MESVTVSGLCFANQRGPTQKRQTTRRGGGGSGRSSDKFCSSAGETLLREEETTLGTPMMTVSAGTGWLAGVSVMADRLALGVDLVEMLISL